MKFAITIEFPGQVVSDTVEFFDNPEPDRGEMKTTALTLVERFCKTQQARYAKYGAKVSWAPLEGVRG
jgi:hypothetical protein